jgi:nucleoside-diphosphate-sugar epimerase
LELAFGVYLPSMRVLIIGCGYVGLELAVELARRGHEVYGVCRSRETAMHINQAGINHIVTDITEPTALEAIEPTFDWIVNTVSSNKGGVEDYRAVYLEGTRRILRWLEKWQPSAAEVDNPHTRPPSPRERPLRRYVYTSSTSVYAQTDGAWVAEESPVEPQSATSQLLVETERLLLDAVRQKSLPAVILRVAGIYGPERGHLLQQYLRSEARIASDGSRLINMVHRDDVVSAIISALERGQSGGFYNVVDDEPVTQLEFFRWLADKLSMPMPPFQEIENPSRKRGLTNKRVSNRKLRLELGCELKYPTFRQGYSAEIARLQAAGRLPVGAGQ